MFRVYTEDTDGLNARGVIRDLLAHHGIASATIYNALGIWQGQAERALVIETDGGPAGTEWRNDAARRGAVYSFAEALRDALKQTAVGIVETADTFTLL